jgi:hypothetical protein
MQLTISSIDYAPEELYEQVPIVAELIRELPGDDRPDYWLARSERPINWMKDNFQRTIDHLVLAAHWQATGIHAGAEHLPVAIAYVTDETLLEDERLDFEKCTYIAIGIVPTRLEVSRLAQYRLSWRATLRGPSVLERRRTPNYS